MRLLRAREVIREESVSGDSPTKSSIFVVLRFPMNFSTAPIIADLFLLAILAIGRQEVHDGTVGADGISPIDIMVFFLALAYIAISIDASGLIRWLAFKVLQKAGKRGHLLYFYLYAFFFILVSSASIHYYTRRKFETIDANTSQSTCAGNDPVILSGTAFLSYMTRVSSNIEHPRAWIYAQFSVANIGSAILVSSNPTNLVLAGAFGIKFIHYTANMVVPVVVTAVVVFPFLLYIIFPGEELIPRTIKLHELPNEIKNKKPVNPNIPNARGAAEESEDGDAETKVLPLEEIMNPFLDKKGAVFGGVIMATTLVTILAVNASRHQGEEFQVYWATLPAAFITFCWDVALGWFSRKETREIARKGREAIVSAQAERQSRRQGLLRETSDGDQSQDTVRKESYDISPAVRLEPLKTDDRTKSTAASADLDEKDGSIARSKSSALDAPVVTGSRSSEAALDEERAEHTDESTQNVRERTTLVSIIANRHRWLQETFPTVMAVLAHLPLKLVPFALAMFVLVQALVTKGWVPVFAHGWGHWVDKTGTVGAIGGMGFLAVILCNVSKSAACQLGRDTDVFPSSPVQTLVPPSCSAASSRLGSA